MRLVIVRLTRAPRGGFATVPASVAAFVKSNQLHIAPQFAGASDQELARYFVVTLPQDEHAEDVATAMGALEDVDTAYVQPVASPAAP